MRASIGGSAKHMSKVTTPPRIDGRGRGYWLVHTNNLTDFTRLGSFWFDGYRTSLYRIRPLFDAIGSIGAFSWHPSGRALAIHTTLSPYLYIYGFHNGEFAPYPQPVSLPAGANASALNRAMSWHPSGRALVMGMSTSPFIEAWEFDLKSGVGAKYAAPSVLPGEGQTTAVFSNSGNNILSTGISGGTTVYAYDWTMQAGFGTRYTATLSFPSPTGGVYWNASDTRVIVAAMTNNGDDLFGFTPGVGFSALIAHIRHTVNGNPTLRVWAGFRPGPGGEDTCAYHGAQPANGIIRIDNFSTWGLGMDLPRIIGINTGNASSVGCELHSWSLDGKFLSGRAIGTSPSTDQAAISSMQIGRAPNEAATGGNLQTTRRRIHGAVQRGVGTTFTSSCQMCCFSPVKP